MMSPCIKLSNPISLFSKKAMTINITWISWKEKLEYRIQNNILLTYVRVLKLPLLFFPRNQVNFKVLIGFIQYFINQTEVPRSCTKWKIVIGRKEQKQILRVNIYMESRKMVLMNLFSWQHWRHSHKEQTHGHRWGRRGWDKLKEEH